MKKLLFTLCLISFYQLVFAQAPSKETLYVIDQIPFDAVRDANLGQVLNEDIFEQRTITNKDSLITLGYPTYKTVIIVTTKKFKNRNPEDLKLPTTRLMVSKREGWYLSTDKKKYTGRFIDYYLNGNKCREGEMLNGKLNGLIKEYYTDETIRMATNFVNDIQDGETTEYYINGSPSLTGFYTKGERIGDWKFYYSTGKPNYEMNYAKAKFTDNLYNPPVASSEYDDIIKTLRRINTLIFNEKYPEALRALDSVSNYTTKANEVFYNKAIVKATMKDYEAAMVDIEKALQIEPLYADALEAKALLLIKKYDWNVFVRHGRFDFTGEQTFKIPEADLKQICACIKTANLLHRLSPVAEEAAAKYCIPLN